MAQSIIAALQQRTSPEAATAPAQAGVKTGNNFTPQYLYDRLIANDDAEVTKMGIVRQMVDAMPTGEFKKLVKDFVALAKEKGEAQLKTAQNHQSVLRVAFGALKHAKDELTKMGYTERTGYQTMRVIAKKALDAKGIKWDGTKVLSDEEREEKKHSAESKKALEEVQMENPQKMGESIKDWLERISNLVDERTEQLRAEARNKAIEKKAEKVHEMLGEDDAIEVMAKVLEKFGNDVYDIIARVDALMQERSAQENNNEGAEQTENEKAHA